MSDPYYDFNDQVGMGGILSTLTFGLIGGKPKVKTLSQDEILSQLTQVVSSTLTQSGKSADLGKIRDSIGYNINAFGAWDRLAIADAATVQTIVDKVIQDLLASNLITVAAGYDGAGTVVNPTPVSQALDIPAVLTSPTTLLIGGAGLLGLILLKGRGRGRR